MSKQTTVQLPTTPIRDRHDLPPSGDWIDRFEGRIYSSSMQSGVLVFEILSEFETDKQSIDQTYAAKERSLKGDLDEQVRKLAGSLEGLLQEEVFERQANAANQLLQQTSSELPAAQATAGQFYGGSPLGKTANDYLGVLLGPHGFSDPRQTWLESYKAAHAASLLAKSIDHLTSRTKGLEVSRKNAQHLAERATKQEQQREQKIHKVELRLLNLDHARQKHESSLRELEEHLARFVRYETEADHSPAEILSAADIEQAIIQLLEARSALRRARYEIESHGMQLAMERTLLQVELNFLLPATNAESTRARINQQLEQSAQAIAAHTASKPEINRLTEEGSDRAMTARDNAQRELVRLTALDGSEAHQRPATFSLATSTMLQPQVITPAASSMAAFAGVRPAMKAALQAVRPVLKGPPKAIVEVASLLLFSLRLGHDERYGMSIPFTDLNVDIDWREVLEQVGESFPLPMRLMSGLIGQNAHVQIVPTETEGVSDQVPVRAATWDEERGAYRFTSEGPGAITVLWTPEAGPGDSSTSLPIETQPDRLYPGFISVPAVPGMMPLPASDDVDFHDYIITFPADSGLEPIYIMFKNPRDYAGVAAGFGQTIPDWRGATISAEGAPIPTQIADQLRGRSFSSWRKLREAIWKATAADPRLSTHYDSLSLDNMRRGGAPYAPVSGRAGKKEVLELHHIHPIAKGGAVYDLDNLVIVTPRAHIDTHRKENNQ
ncbi:S-type pyocin domain-containing protein [Pseudomonas huaxiensis]|uniref:S-type pyocin domain-containing protein n=1 Tax=Pseudomonas huaxiensis TaxID=2213017 RepID=UPI000DA65942|nr:S-type pyocin domain-containing protein [Pseudomonas huaxiensis]